MEPQKEQAKIILPEESFYLAKSKDKDGQIVLMVINSSLRHRRDDAILKQVFGYYCSIVFDYEDVDDNLWPTSEEFSVMRDYVERVDKAIKNDMNHPNALFVARITHAGTCQMIWMLNNPDITIEYLDRVIANKEQEREFEYQIESDVEWDSIGYFLQDFPEKEE